MKSILPLAAMSVLLLCVTLGAQTWQERREDQRDDRAWASKTYRGAIISISGNNFTMELKEGGRISAHVDSKTQIVVENRKITLTDIPTGSLAIASPGSTYGLVKKLEIVRSLDGALAGGKDKPAKKK